MKNRYIVVAVATGDGVADFGHRVWSQEFFSLDAAQSCINFLTGKNDIDVKLIKDERE